MNGRGIDRAVTSESYVFHDYVETANTPKALSHLPKYLAIRFKNILSGDYIERDHSY